MQLQPQSTQDTADWINGRQDIAGGDVDAQASGQSEAAVAVAASGDLAEAAQASPRAIPSGPGMPRSKANPGQRRKPWGSSMTLRLGSRGSSQSLGGSGNRDKAVGSRSPQRGLSQSSLRLQSGLSAVGSFLGSFHGGNSDGSRSEGCSPRQHARHLPSFMGSTRSSQAHMHAQPSQVVAQLTEQAVHKEPFRPSGVHAAIGSDSDAEHAAEGKSNQAQHAQHGRAELSPRSVASIVPSGFMDSTWNSRAQHHSEKLDQQHGQHDPRKDEELTSNLDASRMHDSRDDMSNSSKAGRRDETIHDDVQGSVHYGVAQLLPHCTGHELQTSVDSVLEMGQGLGNAKHFMQPTASSLAHTTDSFRTSIGKSVSLTNL